MSFKSLGKINEEISQIYKRGGEEGDRKREKGGREGKRASRKPATYKVGRHTICKHHLALEK